MKELLQIVKNLQQEETQLEEEYDKEKARMAPELLDHIYYRVFGLTDEDLEVDVDVLDEDEWVGENESPNNFSNNKEVHYSSQPQIHLPS